MQALQIHCAPSRATRWWGGRERIEPLGRLLARERIERILDANTEWLELSPLAAFEMYGGEAPSAGIVQLADFDSPEGISCRIFLERGEEGTIK